MAKYNNKKDRSRYNAYLNHIWIVITYSRLGILIWDMVCARAGGEYATKCSIENKGNKNFRFVFIKNIFRQDKQDYQDNNPVYLVNPVKKEKTAIKRDYLRKIVFVIFPVIRGHRDA